MLQDYPANSGRVVDFIPKSIYNKFIFLHLSGGYVRFYFEGRKNLWNNT